MKENEIVFIDYKMSSKSNTYLKEKYQTQLQLYEYALSKRFNKQIKKYILNLNKNQLIEM